MKISNHHYHQIVNKWAAYGQKCVDSGELRFSSHDHGRDIVKAVSLVKLRMEEHVTFHNDADYIIRLLEDIKEEFEKNYIDPESFGYGVIVSIIDDIKSKEKELRVKIKYTIFAFLILFLCAIGITLSYAQDGKAIINDDSKIMIAKYCKLYEEGLQISATNSFFSLDLRKKITHLNSEEILSNAILKDIQSLDVSKERKHFIVQQGKPLCYFDYHPYSEAAKTIMVLIKGSFQNYEGYINVDKLGEYIQYTFDDRGILIDRVHSKLGIKS